MLVDCHYQATVAFSTVSIDTAIVLTKIKRLLFGKCRRLSENGGLQW